MADRRARRGGDIDGEGLKASDLGSPVRKHVGGDGKVSVRAIASAYDKLEAESRKQPERTRAPKAEGEDLDLEDADLDIEDDELVLDEDELDLDEDDGAPAAAGGGAAAAAAADDGDELELSADDLDLDDDDDGTGEHAAPTGAVTKAAGNQDAGLTANDLGDDDDLDLEDEELELSDEDTAPADSKKNAANSAGSPTAAAKPAAAADDKKTTDSAKPAATSSKPAIVTARGPDGLPIVTVQSHTLPNNKFLREPFRVIKVDEAALLGTSKKERIWDVDFFAKKFSNLDMAGYKSFSQPASNLFRVEKHVSDARRLVLYFFDAPHPYDLILTSAERRNRFYELAMLQRKNSIMWCPSLCPDGINDAVINVTGTTIMRPSGKLARVTGEGKMTVARMPYEIIDFWFGCLSLQRKALPPNFSMLEKFMPKGNHDVYVVGVADIPNQLVGKPDIGVFFSSYMGAAFHVLSQTIVESKDAPDKTCNGILVIVRRSFILRTSNIDAIEIDNIGKDGTKRSDFTLVAAQVRINESLLCCCMVNVSPMATQDPLGRTGGIRALLNGITMGNDMLDIGCRYDYLFVASNFGFEKNWAENDGLLAQNKNLLQTMKEGTPDAVLKAKAGADPFRILYEARAGTCRVDVKQYYAAPGMPLNNAAVSTDLFTLRAFLSTFGEFVPKTQIRLQNLSIVSERLPNYTAGEIHFIGDWIEGAPHQLHMLRHGEGYTINEASIPPLRPVIHNHEYVRLQHIDFTIMGFLEHVKTPKGKPKKIIIASASLSLKSLLEKGKSKEFATPLIYRGCVVGSIVGSLVYEETM